MFKLFLNTEKSRPSSQLISSKSTSALGRSQSLRDGKCGGVGRKSLGILSPSRLSRNSSRGSSLSRSPSLQVIIIFGNLFFAADRSLRHGNLFGVVLTLIKVPSFFPFA